MSGRGAGHLSDEQLSDVVDGSGPPAASEHLAGCPECRSRLDAWRDVVGRLAGLGGRGGVEGVGPHVGPIGERAGDGGSDGMGERAGDGMGERVSERVVGGIARREAAVAAALEAADSVPDRPGRTAAPRGRERSRRGWIGAGSGLAAAVLIVVGVAVGLHAASSGSGSSGSAKSASVGSAPNGQGAAASGSAAGGGSGLSGGSATLAGPVVFELGSVSGPAALASAVEGALSSTSSASGVGGTTAGGSASEGGPASATTVAPLLVPPTVPAERVPAGVRDCVAPADLFGAASRPSVLLRGVLVYRSVPAQVVVYQVGPARRAVVMRDGTCAVLADVGV